MFGIRKLIKLIKDCMCKYVLDLTGFNGDKPEDYYDTKQKISTTLVRYNISIKRSVGQ